MTDVPRTVPAHLLRALARHGDHPAQEDREGQVSLRDVLERAARLASGLGKAGVGRGDRVGFYADNSRRWIVADVAIQLAGAISVPRGTDTPVDEIADLFAHAEVGLVLAHDAKHARLLEAARARVPTMGEIVSIDPAGAPGRTLDDLEEAGRGGPSLEELAAQVSPEDVATIIYTSGTTGRPKGVVLTQANFGHQVEVVPRLFHMLPTEVFLSILPPWHIFERTVEYAALAAGARIAYTDRRHFKEDLGRFRPTFVPSVPRLWETVYDGIRKAVSSGSGLRRALFRGGYAIAKAHAWGVDRARGHLLRIHRPRGPGLLVEGLARAGALLTAAVTWPLNKLVSKVVFGKIRGVTGGRLRGAISGGGLMPAHIDEFFRVVGVPILVGYGLTETSPVVTVRRETRNVLGTIGTPIPEVEVAIRDPDTGRTLPAGETGIVVTRGPHVMQGYYKDPELTRQVIDDQGWFDTGDLGALTEEGDLCFRGRAKETIVLAGGENVDPGHVEEAILASPLVAQALVVGQDRKTLAVLVLPNAEELQRAHVAENGEPGHLAADPKVQDLVKRAVLEATARLKPFERVTRVALLPEALDVSNGCLTQTMKPRRHVITQRFHDLIERAYGA
jgi:long-chain acyl-CoA synthetase